VREGGSELRGFASNAREAPMRPPTHPNAKEAPDAVERLIASSGHDASGYRYPQPRVMRSPGSRAARIEEALIAELTRLGWAEGDLATRGRVTNVRFLFYRLESLGVIPKKLDGAKPPGQYVSEVATELREAAVFPLDCIVDENRAVESHAGWPTIAEGVSDLIDQVPLDPWTGEAPVPFLIVESRSLLGTLRELADEYRVKIVALGGQASLSLCLETARALPPWTRALVLTDLDKSGADIERSACERILAFRSEPLDLTWERLAITEAQVLEHDLTVLQKYDGGRGASTRRSRQRRSGRTRSSASSARRSRSRSPSTDTTRSRRSRPRRSVSAPTGSPGW
jgi:hypothetical protein